MKNIRCGVAVISTFILLGCLLTSCVGNKYYLTENNFLYANDITDLDEYMYDIRNDNMVICYVEDEKNVRYNENGIPETFDSYRTINLTNGESAIWNAHRTYIGSSRVDRDEYFYAGNAKKESIISTYYGGEVVIHSLPKGIEAEHGYNIRGDKVTTYIITDETTTYKVTVHDKYKNKWIFDGEDAAFEGEFTELPQMVFDDDNRLALYFPTGKSCFVVSQSGNKIDQVTVPEENGETKAELYLRDGKAILCRSYEDNSHTIYELDSENLSFSEGTTVTADPNSDEYLILNGYTIGYADENGLYGVEEGKTKCIFKWKDIGLDYEMLDEIHTIEKEKFFVIYHDEEGKLCDGVIGVLEENDESTR